MYEPQITAFGKLIAKEVSGMSIEKYNRFMNDYRTIMDWYTRANKSSASYLFMLERRCGTLCGYFRANELTMPDSKKMQILAYLSEYFEQYTDNIKKSHG